MRRLLPALLLAPALALAAPFAVTIDRGYVGPIEVDLTDALPVPAEGAAATLKVYASVPYTRAAAAIQTTHCQKAGATACLIFNLLAGDAYYPGSYYAEIALTDSGTVQPWHGTVQIAGTIPTPAPAPPAVLGSPLLTVCGSGCAYTSVAQAVGSVLDASTSKPYLVLIGPGIYTEPVLTMKPAVDVKCMGNWYSTTLDGSGNTSSFIIGAAGSSLYGCGVKGPTCTGCAAIDSTVTGFTPFIVEHVAIRSGYPYGIRHHPATYGTLHAHEVVNQYAGSTMGTFMQVESPGNLTAAWDSYMSGPSASVDRVFSAVGINATMTLDLPACHAAGSTDCIYADGGAKVRVTAGTAHSGTNALHVGPNGSSQITAPGIVIDDGYTKDVWIESATGTITISGAVAHAEKFTIAAGAQVLGDFADFGLNRRVIIGCMQLMGTDGVLGPSICHGDGVPTGPEVDGSLYLRTGGGGGHYQREAGVWRMVSSEP